MSDSQYEYMTVAEVAQRMQVTTRTIHRLIERGHFPGAHKIDPTRKRSPYRIPKVDVETFLKSHWGEN